MSISYCLKYSCYNMPSFMIKENGAFLPEVRENEIVIFLSKFRDQPLNSVAHEVQGVWGGVAKAMREGNTVKYLN